MTANDRGAVWPIWTLILVLAGIAILLSPPILSKVVSLTWQVGDVRWVAASLSALSFLLSAAIFWKRAALRESCRRRTLTRPRFWLATAVVVSSCCLTLAAVEIGLRVSGRPFSGSWTPSENALAQFDSELGWSYIPNKTTIQEFGTPPSSVAIHFDRSGFRVADPQVELSSEEPSILFVGGSYTMGHGLNFEQTFIGQLQGMEGFEYQTVNLGVQAFGTDQSFLQLKRHLNSFNARVVVYTFLGDHVLRTANYDRRMLFPDASFIATKPLFGLDGNGELYLKKKPRKYEDLIFVHSWAVVESAWTRSGPGPTLDLTRAILLEMKKLSEAHGARFIVVDWEQAHPDAIGRGLLSDMEIDLIDTRDYSPEGWHDWKIPGDGHPNAAAHRFVAQLLFDKLVDGGLIASRAPGAAAPTN